MTLIQVVTVINDLALGEDPFPGIVNILRSVSENPLLRKKNKIDRMSTFYGGIMYLLNKSGRINWIPAVSGITRIY